MALAFWHTVYTAFIFFYVDLISMLMLSFMYSTCINLKLININIMYHLLKGSKQNDTSVVIFSIQIVYQYKFHDIFG